MSLCQIREVDEFEGKIFGSIRDQQAAAKVQMSEQFHSGNWRWRMQLQLLRERHGMQTSLWRKRGIYTQRSKVTFNNYTYFFSTMQLTLIVTISSSIVRNVFLIFFLIPAAFEGKIALCRTACTAYSRQQKEDVLTRMTSIMRASQGLGGGRIEICGMT